MDIIASDALKNTKWGHMVNTKTTGLLSITYTRNKVYQPPPPPQASFIADDTLLNHLNFRRSKHTLTLQQISLALNHSPIHSLSVSKG